MNHVLERINKKRSNDTPQADVADRMYQTLMSDIEQRATEKARKEVMVELEGAKAATVRVEAERDAAIMMKEASESMAEGLKEEIHELKEEVSEKEGMSEEGEQAYTDNIQVVKSDLSQERLKVQSLEVQVANLEGKLSEKQIVQAPQVIKSSPMVIPSFEVTPVRGQDGRIQTATIKPVTH